MEGNLRRALLVWDGAYTFLWERPLTWVVMLATFVVLLAPLLVKLKGLIKKTLA